MQQIKQKPMILYAKNEINTVPLKRLTFKEIDLFFYFCFCLNEKEAQKITLTFNEIKKILDFKPTDIERLDKLILRTHKKLLEVNFTIQEKDKDILFPVFYSFEIDRKNKNVSIQIHPHFQHVLNYFKKGNFTRINLLEMVSLKLNCSKKLYPILKQFETTGQVYLRELREWREMLCIPEAYDYRLINRKMLTPSIKELLPFFPNLELKKKSIGRKITHIWFTFKPLIKEEVKNTVFKDKKTSTKNQKQLTIFDLEKEKQKAECSIVHKNMYEENDCEKIHWLNNNNNTLFADNNDIVWDWDKSVR